MIPVKIYDMIAQEQFVPVYAPVAQWIEHWTPVPCAEVRFLSGVFGKGGRRELSVWITAGVICAAAFLFPQISVLNQIDRLFPYEFCEMLQKYYI